jgi:non-ribosomal peptide synthetase component F
MLEAYAHQHVPFNKLLEELQPESNQYPSPLFQVTFVFLNAHQEALKLPALTITPFRTDNKTAKYDLLLSMNETEVGLKGVWEYDTDLFESVRIKRMTKHFQTLLERIVSNPNQNIQDLITHIY